MDWPQGIPLGNRFVIRSISLLYIYNIRCHKKICLTCFTLHIMFEYKSFKYFISVTEKKYIYKFNKTIREFIPYFLRQKNI